MSLLRGLARTSTVEAYKLIAYFLSAVSFGASPAVSTKAPFEPCPTQYPLLSKREDCNGIS